ncbi:aspartate kinase [Saccharicrinis aurantiacus]|uniref:aspartate kinase n=1 Tax=Saccharicrinis aurantiacus TaxID=1849719 RepID=UPI0024929D66|nr:aspartate kinase [Saccharicrinis aurantiacus]
MIQVYKFGGASVKDANGVKNVINIIGKAKSKLVVVVSAMGKTTNAFESLLDAFFSENTEEMNKILQTIYDNHNRIIGELFEKNHPFNYDFDQCFNTLRQRLEKRPSLNYDFEYDQIVSFGEIFSTKIVSAYANLIAVENTWVDVREVLKTDENYRDAGVNWNLTSEFMKAQFSFNTTSVYFTQGFIGSTINNISTTLGREGSDYTGAVIAHILNANALTIWKDVPGVLNADPRWYEKAVLLPEISYSEAIELSYYGAQVIHPKTLKPLQNKSIPLYVRSFIDSDKEGSVIQNSEVNTTSLPVFILKKNQIFITVSPKDFSFILEDNLSDIFHIFSEHKVKINLMQNSALNFSVCVNEGRTITALLKALSADFIVRYNTGVELLTIRSYNDEVIEELTFGKEIIDSQLSRKTARFVIKELN